MKLNFDYNDDTHMSLSIKRILSQIDLQVSTGTADIYVKQADQISDEDLNSGKLFIAIEKRDGANISKRKVLQHTSVLKYVKQYKYKYPEFNNAACVGGRGFTRYLCNESLWESQKTLITPNQDKKIILGWNFLHYPRLAPFYDIRQFDSKSRPIDVFFAGRIEYINGDKKSGALISEHRLRCIEKLLHIKNLKIVNIQGRQLNAQKYMEYMRNSKIAISPWGWGEACYRDYEAILSGCLLIKPNTDFVMSSCNIFEQKERIWTMPDFSDLSAKIIFSIDAFNSSFENRLEQRGRLLVEKNSLPQILNRIFKF